MLKRNLRSILNSTASRLILSVGEDGEEAETPLAAGGETPPPEGETPPPAEGETPPAAAAGEDGGEEEPAKPARTPWWNRRIDKLTADTRAATAAREAAERERDEARAQAAAYKALYGDAPAGGTPPPADAPPAGDAPRTFTEADVTARAAEIARVTTLNAKLESLFEEGGKTYGEGWQAQVTAAGTAFGDVLTSQRGIDFFEALSDLPNPTEVYHALTADLDHMDEVLAMPPLKLGMELARMSAKAAAKPKGPGISRAPAPINPVTGAGGEAPKDMAKVPMTDYAADFERRRAARHEAQSR